MERNSNLCELPDADGMQNYSLQNAEFLLQLINEL